MPKALTFSDYGGPEHQALVEVAKPVPGPGELQISVRATGVNPADWKVRAGFYKSFMAIDLPAVLGREAAGVVEAVGADVTGFAVGDEVFGNAPRGSYGEYAVLTADASALKPSTVSFIDAATLPVGAGTGYDVVEQVNPNRGDTVLITGAGGGVGVAAVQFAVARGARVIGTASPSKHELLRRLGAEPVDYDGDVESAVRAVAPEGIVAIIDLVGGDALRTVAPLLGDRSRLVTAADVPTAVELGGANVERNRSTDQYRMIAALVADGSFDPHVTATYPLEQAAAALAEVENGHTAGKVVITVP